MDALTDVLVKGGIAPSRARLAAKVAMAAFGYANRRWANEPTIELGAAIAQAADEVLTLAGDPHAAHR